MGLLDKAITNKLITPVGDIDILLADFQQNNPLFHCIVLEFEVGEQQALADIVNMTAFHGAVCCSLPHGRGLVLLPGALDMELFSHQFSMVTGSTVLLQFSASSSSHAVEILSTCLQ